MHFSYNFFQHAQMKDASPRNLENNILNNFLTIICIWTNFFNYIKREEK